MSEKITLDEADKRFAKSDRLTVHKPGTIGHLVAVSVLQEVMEEHRKQDAEIRAAIDAAYALGEDFDGGHAATAFFKIREILKGREA
jgi:hypothetical protein